MTDVRQKLFLPLLTMALSFALFGLATAFVQEQTVLVDKVLLAALFAGLALSSFLFHRASNELEFADATAVAASFRSLIFVQGGTAALLAFVPGQTALWLVLVASAGFLISGVIYLLVGLRLKENLPVWRDLQLAGLIAIVTALVLPVLSEVGEKAILGITGAGALIAGVFLLIGSFTLRMEPRN